MTGDAASGPGSPAYRRAEAFLDELNEHADRVYPLLPFMDVWLLDDDGFLTGETGGPFRTPEETREQMVRWAAHLGAHIEEKACPDGTVELYAPWAAWKSPSPVRGCLRAHLPSPEQQDATTPLVRGAR
ncbi:hypothetical protein [Streptomyces sp. NPDC058657]|uniref:hypothetical protein n=1 Tax=unclassified Streptomyces TaxID=2593676 RepID=UPI003653B3A8